MATVTNQELWAKVGVELGTDASAIDFLPFGSLEDAVTEDVRFLRESPLIPEEVPVRGFVYDVRSGRVTEVE
jgi:carbonic anhydrase